MSERDPHVAIDYIIKHARLFSEAKAKRVYLEEFRKSLKAILMKKQDNTQKQV